jgi:hypothetical protein
MTQERSLKHVVLQTVVFPDILHTSKYYAIVVIRSGQAAVDSYSRIEKGSEGGRLFCVYHVEELSAALLRQSHV